MAAGFPIEEFQKRIDAAVEKTLAAGGNAGPSEYGLVSKAFSPSALDIQRRAASGLGQAGLGKGPITGAEGWQRMPNGVLVNPSQQTVLFPTQADGIDPAEIPGSEEWLQAIQKKWTDKQFNAWRKRLIDQGYDQAVTGGIASKGGAALDVINGLRAYHQTRYLNGGKAIAFAPVDVITREAIRKQVDFVTLKEEVKTWGEVPFGEDLDEETAEYFSERMIRKMTQLAREHPTWSFEQVEAGAQTRTQKQFIKTPGVKGALREAEEDEMDESLRENIVSIAQLGSF